MQLHHFTDPALFEGAVLPFLAPREAEHNLLIGLISNMKAGELLDPAPYLAAIEHDGAVILVAIRTPPMNLLISHVEPVHYDEALALLAADVHRMFDGELRGATSTPAIANAFARHWQTLTGQTSRVFVNERIYQLDNVIWPQGVAGMMRRADAGDTLVVDWIRDFLIEAFPEPQQPERAAERFHRYVNGPESLRGMMLWEVDGMIVSMCGYQRPTPSGMCIGPVYTPPDQRRNGYAGMLVAAASQMLLDRGRQFCFLYTDLANPTSNHVYQQIGYKPICDVDELRFIRI